jgi:hypothetical protein
MGHRYTLQLSAKPRPQEFEFYGNGSLGTLSDDFWIHRYTRRDWNSSITVTDQDKSKFYKRSNPAARELIELCLLHTTFELETAYNPFNLLRNIEHAEDSLWAYKVNRGIRIYINEVLWPMPCYRYSANQS